MTAVAGSVKRRWNTANREEERLGFMASSS